MESIVAQAAAAAVFLSSPVTPTYDPQRIVVKLEAGTPPAALGPLALAAGVELERALPQINVYVFRARRSVVDALAALRRHPAVEAAQREVVLTAVDTAPNDFDWPEQWGLRRTEFPQAWDAAQNGSRTVVAVLDTGVERTHPELAGLVLRGTDFVNDDGDAADDNGHGTAVAGIIAARANNGIGIAGACWPCAILPVKVLGRNGSGITSDVAAGIIWAVERGARVINMSLGGFGTTIALRDALAYAAARDVVLVGAAGNNGLSDRFYPAADQDVIAVAASNPADQLYVWSNRGPWVDVAAPGCTPTLWRGAGYAGFCGTSAASPIVAALAGLIRSTRPAASSAEVTRAITESAHAIASVERGRIDAARALSVSRLAPVGRGRRTGAVFVKRRLQALARTRSSSPPRHAGPAAASAPDSKPATPLLSPPAVSGPRVAISPTTKGGES